MIEKIREGIKNKIVFNSFEKINLTKSYNKVFGYLYDNNILTEEKFNDYLRDNKFNINCFDEYNIYDKIIQFVVQKYIFDKLNVLETKPFIQFNMDIKTEDYHYDTKLIYVPNFTLNDINVLCYNLTKDYNVKLEYIDNKFLYNFGDTSDIDKVNKLYTITQESINKINSIQEMLYTITNELKNMLN